MWNSKVINSASYPIPVSHLTWIMWIIADYRRNSIRKTYEMDVKVPQSGCALQVSRSCFTTPRSRRTAPEPGELSAAWEISGSKMVTPIDLPEKGSLTWG